MRIPKEFIIRGETWRVEYKWRLTYRNSPVVGLCDPDIRTIFIDRSLSKEEKWWTFVHEFIHAVLDEYKLGINSKIPYRKLLDEHEEEIIQALESEFKSNFKMKWRTT